MICAARGGNMGGRSGVLAIAMVGGRGGSPGAQEETPYPHHNKFSSRRRECKRTVISKEIPARPLSFTHRRHVVDIPLFFYPLVLRRPNLPIKFTVLRRLLVDFQHAQNGVFFREFEEPQLTEFLRDLNAELKADQRGKVMFGHLVFLGHFGSFLGQNSPNLNSAMFPWF